MKITIKTGRMHSEQILLFFYLTLPVWRNLIFSHIPAGYMVMNGGLLAFIAYSLLKYKSKINQYYDIFALYGGIALLFIFQFLMNSSMQVWLTRDYGVRSMFITCGIYSYAVFRLQKSPNQTLQVMKRVGLVLILYYAYQSLDVLRNGYWTYTQFGILIRSSSNMSWSYGLLFASCLLAIYFFCEKKVIVFVPIGISLIGILIYGSRGTIIAFACGMLMAIIFVNKGKLKTRQYVLLVLFIIAVVFIFSDTGLGIIKNWLNASGLSSRFIDSLTLKQSFERISSGRTQIWATVIELIKSRPVIGYGVMGERNAVYAIGEKWGYSHNIILETIVSFGIIVGSIILLSILLFIIRFMRDSRLKEERILMVIFITVSMELLLSNTIWLHFGIWSILAIYKNHFQTKWHLLDINS